jgi:Tfp pilus assembly protein PilO
VNREKAEHILFIVLVIAIIVIGGYMFVLRPRLADLQKIQAGSEELDLKLSEAQIKAQSVPRLRNRTRTLAEQVTSQEALMVQGGEFSDFLFIIKAAADTAGLKLQNAKPRDDVPPVQESKYVERWVRVQTQAPYHGLGRFVYELERNSPYVRVVDLEVRAQPVEIGLHSANVTVGFLVKPTDDQ